MKTEKEIEEPDENIKIFLIKLMNIMIISIYYFFTGISVSYFLNTVSTKLDKKKNKFLILLEVLIEVALTVIFHYLFYRLLIKIRLPYENTDYRIEHTIAKEVKGSILAAFSLMLIQDKLKDKVRFLLKLD